MCYSMFSYSCSIFCERLVNVICLLKDCRDGKFFYFKIALQQYAKGGTKDRNPNEKNN